MRRINTCISINFTKIIHFAQLSINTKFWRAKQALYLLSLRPSTFRILGMKNESTPQSNMSPADTANVGSQ